ncbi:hypothetical protein T01_5320 [Trichinella spiralis]|uniref:Uncharacterized protein n=1 Tax=Trichinella spiralis TaxID=6334 RepID=A0A0V1BK11_TRISP|nr:hypothetical protein T01_5320 [Trichinella spiralis]
MQKDDCQITDNKVITPIIERRMLYPWSIFHLGDIPLIAAVCDKSGNERNCIKCFLFYKSAKYCFPHRELSNACNHYAHWKKTYESVVSSCEILPNLRKTFQINFNFAIPRQSTRPAHRTPKTI